MKKKFVTGLLLLAVTAGGVSTFTSCKDTNEDLYAELRGENATLRADLLEIEEKCGDVDEALTKFVEKNTFELAIAELRTAFGESIKQGDLDDYLATYLTNSNYVTKDKLGDELRTALADYIKTGDVDQKYATKDALQAVDDKFVDYLKENDFNQKIADYIKKNELDTEVSKLGYLKSGDIETKITQMIQAWATEEGVDGLRANVKVFLDQLKEDGYWDDLKGEGGTNCTCALKDLSEDEAKTLVALVAHAKELFGDDLDGKGGMMKDLSDRLQTLEDELNGTDDAQGLIKDVKELQETLYGKDGEDGLVQAVNTLKGTVDDLSLWFNFEDPLNPGTSMTPELFQKYVEGGAYVVNNKKVLTKLIGLINEGTLNEDALRALNQYYQDLEGIDDMYKAIFADVKGLPEGETAWWNYAEVINNIKQNSKAIEALQEDVEALLNRMNDMVTSLILQAANNKVYPAFNTPFGLNSMVLMTYYGHLATSVEEFPVSNAKNLAVEMYADGNVSWDGILSSEPYRLESDRLAYTEDGLASLGTLWFTVNPGTVRNLDKNGFSLVNSKEEESAVKFSSIQKDDETLLTFGMGSRAVGNGNGLYQAKAAVALDDLDKIKVNIEPGLVDALKDAVKNHKGSDMLHLLKVINTQLNNVCVANALRYTYNPVTGRDENGKLVSEEEAKVYSNYGLAATAFKPLSFATLKGSSVGKHLPTISPIEIDKDMVNLDLGTFKVDSENFKLNLNFGKPEFSPIGDVIVETEISLTDDEGRVVSGTQFINISKEAQQIVNNVTGSIEEWLGGKDGKPTLDERVEKAIWIALFNDKTAVNPKYPYDASMPTGVVADLIDQVNNMTGQIQDKLDDLVNQINKDYLGKVNNLISKYNTVADRINGMLDDPNHYLQTVMFYRKSNGGLGLISTDPKNPTRFEFKGGDAIKLYATTYNFETVCPTFKKIVGVTKVTDQNGVENTKLKNDANSVIAKVVNGDKTAFALPVAGAKGGVYTYEIAYQALDYTGYVSTVKTYIQVKGK